MTDGQTDLFGLLPSDAIDPEQIPQDVTIPILPDTYKNLDGLIEHCNRCHRCELGNNRRYAVVARGNPHAPVMIVGEGPGENEDLTGRPFVGKAGQLLDKILASVKLDSEQDTYICNIVKCRPPSNRKPTGEEMSACVGYLKEQIRLVDPRIILLTGASAVEGLLGDKRGITKIRGQWINWDGRWVMPLLHPAFLLRNQSREVGSPKWLTWQDIQQVRSKFDELRA